MRFGLKEKSIEQIIECLRTFPEITEAIIYGSRAKGNYKIDSDIDLTIKGPELSLSIQFKLANKLDDLLLPYQFDLSVYHQINNPDLIEHIKRVGQTFYKKPV